MAKVSLKGLTKRFGDQIAVNNVSLDIEDKELLVLLGPSGCGKTTTLRCIAGLESPDDGEMYIQDTLVNELSPKDRNIAMVFESYVLYPHMSVDDNIAFPLKMQKLPKNERDTKVRRTAKLLRISHLLDRKPKQLSGGEAQRVKLAKELSKKSTGKTFYILDEPTTGLSTHDISYLLAVLQRLVKEGNTVVVIEHNLDVIKTCDWIIELGPEGGDNGGMILATGTPEQISHIECPTGLFLRDILENYSVNTSQEKNVIETTD